MLSFYRGERMFGSDSQALMGRKPELSFAKTSRMLGRSTSHPLVQEITSQQFFPYSLYANETTGTACLKVEDSVSTYYSPEEMVAMLLQHAKDMTAAFGGNKIKDCVLTVPSSYTQHERKALYTAGFAI
jgi:hypoxia up-regulated 1